MPAVKRDKARLEKYQVAVDLLIFEGQMLWQIVSAFMLVHTILIGFIATLISKESDLNSVCIIMCSLGIILLIPWYATYRRNTAYYEFRMAQARNSEPLDWKLLRGDGRDFAQGKGIQFTDSSKEIKIPPVGRAISNKRAVVWIIVVFLAVYISILYLLIQTIKNQPCEKQLHRTCLAVNYKERHNFLIRNYLSSIHMLPNI